jgi:transposase
VGKGSWYPAEVRERAVRLVVEQEGSHASQWAAISSIASKMGCTPETLRKWVRPPLSGCPSKRGKISRYH